MNVPYPVEELDRIMRACIRTHDELREESIPAGYCIDEKKPDVSATTRVMHWIVGLDSKLLEFKGINDKDNVPYWQLGHDAKQMMQEGGFAVYLRRKQREEVLAELKGWSIVISLFALIVSALSWQFPKEKGKFDDLKAQFEVLKSKHERLEGEIEAIRKLSAPKATVEDKKKSIDDLTKKSAETSGPAR